MCFASRTFLFGCCSLEYFSDLEMHLSKKYWIQTDILSKFGAQITIIVLTKMSKLLL